MAAGKGVEMVVDRRIEAYAKESQLTRRQQYRIREES